MKPTDNDNPPASVKAAWRKRVDAARAEITREQRDAEAAALARGLVELSASTVCAYVPFGTEPGSAQLLDVLRSRGVRVLLPVVPTGHGPLDWAEYSDVSSLRPGRYAFLLEPAGPRLGPHAVAEADIVLVPALAVDRVGVRLGRGAGHYDRSLVLASRRTRFVAVIRDTELVDRLPAEPHDVRMHAALTPGRGVVSLAESAQV
ncbi:5-formyltetrahydrofolate cyclo-ligase [Saccharomonospora xinjiangensis]|uniref:5-formyltetrahydrofolate cyclo-ligase n=1 Tax=Saccharomonospora xinjiangensis TaxID=75294 RepID=UPI00106FE1DE|nr:5-formyltetrahydrofolate cyclo-ligase [Saccharomonospora xinjiangensis]QBQ61988.1 5-formyltetrahydrofolate cyclo-ligase family protein [Saccharomonospora xinjiangensis]